MGRGSTDRNTIKLQQLLRSHEKNEDPRYNDLDELLSSRGYIIYRNADDILMVRRSKDAEKFTDREVMAILKGTYDHDNS